LETVIQQIDILNACIFNIPNFRSYIKDAVAYCKQHGLVKNLGANGGGDPPCSHVE
jgi:hypothetical protein